MDAAHTTLEIHERRDGRVPCSALLGGWQPLDTAPRDGTYILLAGPSGYIGTPLRVEVCKYDAEYRPRQPWVTFSNDSFMDGGEAPTCWMPLPPPNVGSQRTRHLVSENQNAEAKTSDGRPGSL